MNTRLGDRLRTSVRAGVIAGVVIAAGLVAVGPTGPAQAGDCAGSQIISAGPGSAGGTILVTFTVTAPTYQVRVYDVPWVGPLTPAAVAPGIPSGTEVAGLSPGASYWVYVISDGDCRSRGVQATAATGVTNLWMQAYGRASQLAACDAGWWGSYAEWPNGGRGGWTCERYLAVYG